MDILRSCLRTGPSSIFPVPQRTLVTEEGEPEPIIRHRNARPQDSLTLSPDTDPEPLYVTDGDPEPLFRTNSYALGQSTPHRGLPDNRENYVIYENLRLEPTCGRQGSLDDHQYVVKYYRKDAVLSNDCDLCGASPHAQKKPSSRCLDCDSHLCMLCYNSLRT